MEHKCYDCGRVCVNSVETKSGWVSICQPCLEKGYVREFNNRMSQSCSFISKNGNKELFRETVFLPFPPEYKVAAYTSNSLLSIGKVLDDPEVIPETLQLRTFRHHSGNVYFEV